MMLTRSRSNALDNINKQIDHMLEDLEDFKGDRSERKLNEDGGISDKEDTAKNSKKILWTTSVVVGVCQGCFFIYTSLLPYLSRTYGMDAVSFGYLQSAAALVQLAVSPLVGRFGDKYGARAVLLLSATSTAIGHMTLGMATSAPMLVFSRVTGVTQDIKLGAQMIVSDLVPGSERGVAMGKLMLPMMIGMLVGPALAGQLAKLMGSQESLLITWIAPVLCIIAIISSIPSVTRQEANDNAKKSGGDDKTSVMSLMRRAPVPLLLVTKVMTAVPFMTLAQSLGVIGMTEFKLTPQMNGLLLSYNGVIGVIVSAFVLGRLLKRFTEDQLMKVAPIFMITAYLLLSQTHSVWMLLVVMIPWNLGNSILDNQIVSRLTITAPTGKTGAMVGLNASMMQLARIVAPLLGGYLIHTLGFQAIGYMGVILSVILTMVLWSCMPPNTKEKMS